MSANPKKNLNCGSCTFLNRDRTFEAPCSQLGRIPTSKACGSHAPDAFALVGNEDRITNLENVGEMMSQMSDNDLQILGAMMLREKATRKNGFHFRQKVYVRIRGASNSNYLSNFVVGYILDATKETIRVIGESGKTAISAINDKNSETVYTVQRFNKLRMEMLAAGRRVDPDILTEEERLANKAKYTTVIPLDDAVKEGILDKKKKAAKDDLVSLVSRMGKGHLKRGKQKEESNAPSAKVRIDHSGM
jgi:hypothetical protein